MQPLRSKIGGRRRRAACCQGPSMTEPSKGKTRLLEQISFLIVEPNTFTRSVVRNVLQVFGARLIAEASDGNAAMKIVKEMAPDIVLTDWNMSPINGIQLTRLIRTSDDSPNRYIPVVMMTSYAERHRVIEARDAGISEFVVKPLSAQSLIDHIIEVIEHPREFVRTSSYFGPDRRRRRKAAFTGTDRRGTGKTAPPAIAPPIDRNAILTQDEIDTVVAGGPIDKDGDDPVPQEPNN
jgi:CheY-like chemotaxis protein